MSKDNLFATAKSVVSDFVFDESVVAVFPDMIGRSIPAYDTVLAVGGLLAVENLRPGGTIVDLGCSLGASSYAALAYLSDSEVRVRAIDNSPAMVQQAQANCRDPRIEFHCQDIQSADLQGADVVLANYIVQFLEPRQRLELLSKIYTHLAPDGVLLLSEKIRFEDPNYQQQMESAHWAFKAANGYSELEISQKRAALENVMRIDTESAHRERLQTAGFTRITKSYQCLNWASFIIQP